MSDPFDLTIPKSKKQKGGVNFDDLLDADISKGVNSKPRRSYFHDGEWHNGSLEVPMDSGFQEEDFDDYIDFEQE